jgi:hypothetical protein
MIHGVVAPGFELVRDTFVRCFAPNPGQWRTILSMITGIRWNRRAKTRAQTCLDSSRQPVVA